VPVITRGRSRPNHLEAGAAPDWVPALLPALGRSKLIQPGLPGAQLNPAVILSPSTMATTSLLG